MGELREKMVRRMELRNFSRKTIKTYLYHMKKYVGYYMKSPDELGNEEIEKYLHYLLQTKVSSSTMVQAYSSFKFFYSECLERTWELEKIPRPKIEKGLPVVLSPEEIRKIYAHILPEGFFKIRYYGILSSRKKKALLEMCRKILSKRKSKKSKDTEAIKSFAWQCPKCKTGIMRAFRIHVNFAPG